MAYGLMPFAESLGVCIERGDATGVVASAEWDAGNCTVGGALHGGFLMGCADAVGAVTAGLNLPAGATTSTIESKTNFFRAATSGPISIAGEPVHVGRSTIVVQTDITRPDGKLVSRSIQTQAVLAPPSGD